MSKPVAITAQWNTFLYFFFDAAPAVSVVNHIWYVMVFVTNVVELKDTMIIQPAVFAVQSLFVLKELLSIALEFFFGSWHQSQTLLQ